LIEIIKTDQHAHMLWRKLTGSCMSDVQSFRMQIFCTQRNDHVINILPMSHKAIQH